MAVFVAREPAKTDQGYHWWLLLSILLVIVPSEPRGFCWSPYRLVMLYHESLKSWRVDQRTPRPKHEAISRMLSGRWLCGCRAAPGPQWMFGRWSLLYHDTLVKTAPTMRVHSMQLMHCLFFYLERSCHPHRSCTAEYQQWLILISLYLWLVSPWLIIIINNQWSS